MANQPKTLEDLGTLKGGEAVAAGVTVHARKLDQYGRAYATGKRKDAVARVWLRPGHGKILVNDKDFAQYFARPVLQMMLKQPLSASSPSLIAHELCHVWQDQDHRLRMWWSYVRGGYADNPHEVEARKAGAAAS